MRTIDDQIIEGKDAVYNLNIGELDFDSFLKLYSTP